MPRPIKGRRVCCMPEHKNFSPESQVMHSENVIMSIDEYETIRLIDLEGLNQEACAQQMEVARTTVQRIYNDARFKIADAIVNGKKLVIEGGDIRLCNKPGQRQNCHFNNSRNIQGKHHACRKEGFNYENSNTSEQ